MQCGQRSSFLSVTGTESYEVDRVFGFWLIRQSREHVPTLIPSPSSSSATASLSFLSSQPFSFYPSHETNMSETSSSSSMAAHISYPSSSNLTSHEHERLDLETIRVFVVSVNEHIDRFLEDPESRKSLQLRCTSKIKIQKQEFFEFSEHSVLSNLYWGILNLEAAIRAKLPEERSSRLKSSEQMLQVPALLDEQGSTGRIQNRYLICCSYFYLSLVRKLQRDEWQVTLHFLQALLISPELVRMEFAPELWESVFFSQIMVGSNEMGGWRGLKSLSLSDDAIDEVTRQRARRYKDWLMYYRIMSYGEPPQWKLRGCGAAPSLQKESRLKSEKDSSSKYLDSIQDGNGRSKFQDGEKVHPLNIQENIIDEMLNRAKASKVSSKKNRCVLKDDAETLLKKLDEVYDSDTEGNCAIKCFRIQDMLEESQTPISLYSHSDSADASDSEIKMYSNESSERIILTEEDGIQSEIGDWELQVTCSTSSSEYIETTPPAAPGYAMCEEAYEGYTSYFSSSRSLSSISDLNLPTVELKNIDAYTTFDNWHVEEGATLRRSEQINFRLFDHLSSRTQKNYSFTHIGNQMKSARNRQDSNCNSTLGEVSLHPEKDVHVEIQGIFDKKVSNLCFSEWIGKCEEDDSVEFSIIWEMLNNKTEEKYELLKDVIFIQLLNAISSSKEEKIIRKSVSILSTLILENKTSIEYIKKKGLRLCDLASVLKRNVHETAILIYLMNPSPAEIHALELLPALLQVACSSCRYEGGSTSPLLTPPAASLAMIEVLVTAFDHDTNNLHLAAISSCQVLARLVHVAKNNNLEEITSLAAILVKCMQFDGKCRSFISQFTPMAPFVLLLRSKEKNVKFAALQFFHEILRMPRSSAISLLHQIRETNSVNIMDILMSCIQQSEPEHRLMAASFLLQLDMLEDCSGTSVFTEEAIKVLLESIASEDNAPQILSASILSNLGGTYAWTGESYTVAWMVMKAGLTSLLPRNMIRNIDWSDPTLQDGGTDAWCSKIARSIIKTGEPVFYALEKGLRSEIKGVSRDCLIAIAWLGCEIAVKGPNTLRHSACEILLSGIEQFLHPGSELDERLLACLCVYKYASGKGMHRLTHFSEGVRESLRRLSSITWMAEELLKVTDYFLQTKSRVSCVHTQILEAGQRCSGAASALIYYKGLLYSGHSDGSIKVWDIKGQIARLVWDAKEHKKAVTCFTLFEPEDSLLSGSADKTIRVWKMVQQKLECTEVIRTMETVKKIDTCGQLIFLITQSRGLKVFDPSRNVNTICKSKHVRCIAVVQRKIYLGCTDSSIQEVNITNGREREIKAPAKSWQMQSKPVNSVLAYKNWLYSASSRVEGLNFEEWRKHNEPKMSITLGRGVNVLIMGVVEDFIYLNCSSSPSILQIWLRGTEKKVGRLSAGSRITSLLTANDIILCGTETGLIKGWIPL